MVPLPGPPPARSVLTSRLRQPSMPQMQPPAAFPPWGTRFERVLAAGLLVAAGLAAWSNSFSGPFVFDDVASIPGNPTIAHLQSVGRLFHPPANDGQTVGGRPLLNLTLALNWAVGGENVLGYHAVNLAIHLTAGLLLFGLVRRTLLLPRWAGRFDADAALLGFSSTALWLLHPLQTESVTYIIQRAESLAGMFCLLSLYAFVRAHASATGPAGQRGWLALSVAACLGGMATKEITVALPLLVLCYDATFRSGTILSAWKGQWRYYLALGATWLLLAAGVFMAGNRGTTAGYGLGTSPAQSLLVQSRAILRYLQLAFWPGGQVFDYGFMLHRPAFAVAAPSAAVVLFLLLVTIGLMARHRPAGFLGAWFFGLLAPSSSIVPVVSQPVAEHRMYLPLAALTVAVTLASYRIGGRKAIAGLGLVAGLLGIATWERNQVYQTELGLWQDTVTKCPANPRAHQEVGLAWYRLGKVDLAVSCLEDALRLHPQYSRAQGNFGTVLLDLGRTVEAEKHFRTALQGMPGLVSARFGLGMILYERSDWAGAARELGAAVSLNPEHALAQESLGNALTKVGRIPESLVHFQAAGSLEPGNPVYQFNLANTYRALDRSAEAIAGYERVLQLSPVHAAAHCNLALALWAAGRKSEAIDHFQTAVRLEPENPAFVQNLSLAKSHR